MLEETYLKIISNKTAALFLAAAKIGSIITEKENKYKDALSLMVRSWSYISNRR